MKYRGIALFYKASKPYKRPDTSERHRDDTSIDQPYHKCCQPAANCILTTDFLKMHDGLQRTPEHAHSFFWVWACSL